MLCWSASYNRNLWHIRQNPKMKSILPILAGLAALLHGATVPAQEPPAGGNSAPATMPQGAEPAGSVSGDALVDRVVAAAVGQASIAAKIRHRVELTGRALIGTGLYLQQGRGASTFRLELQLRTTLFATSLQHICDGSHLWILEELDGQKNVAVVDMGRLQRAQAKSQVPSQPPATLVALAGLPKLLSGLQDNFLFTRVVESRLDELHVWSIEGTWEPAKLAQLLPDQTEKIASGMAVDLSPLAANLPHRVVLHVGSDDLFPYRIEYWRSEPAEDGEAAGREKLIVVMEFYEVQLGGRLDPALFVFRPEKGVSPIDRTQEFLDRLGLEDLPPEEARRRLRSPLQ
jgi:hypothetical protein